MLKLFNRFILLALIVAAALYITLNNSEPATLKITPSTSITAYAGVIYIGVFVVGCVVASFVALFFGFKGYLRERKLKSSERSRQNFFSMFEKARDHMAGGDWGAARQLWEDILNRDSDSIIARVELSECLEQLGDPREALRVLDATRANAKGSSKESTEVLYRAAILNHKLGNNTAALDNLTLILSRGPSRQALEMARDRSQAIGEFTQALSYHEELEKMGFCFDLSDKIRENLTLAQITTQNSDSTNLRDALKSFVKRYPNSTSAYEKLAEIDRSLGNIDLSAENLVKAARTSGGDVSKWRAVVNLWLTASKGDQSERALAAARSATKDQHGIARLEGEILLIETLLWTNRFPEAERHLEDFTALAEREVGTLPLEILTALTIQKGCYLSQIGSARDTAPLWGQLASLANGGPVVNRANLRDKGDLTTSAPPSPTLSTP